MSFRRCWMSQRHRLLFLVQLLSLLKRKRRRIEIWRANVVQRMQKPLVRHRPLRMLTDTPPLYPIMLLQSPQLLVRRAHKDAGSSAKNTGMTCSSNENAVCLTLSLSAVDLSAAKQAWSPSPVSAAVSIGAAPLTNIMREQQDQRRKKDRDRVQLADSVWQQVGSY